MPVLRPWRSRIAAAIRVVEDLPFVPSTWIASKRCSGEPSTVIIRRILSRPKRIPNSSSERSLRSACASVQFTRAAATLAPTPTPAPTVARQREQLAPETLEVEPAHEPAQLQPLFEAEVANAASGLAEQAG